MQTARAGNGRRGAFTYLPTDAHLVLGIVAGVCSGDGKDSDTSRAFLGLFVWCFFVGVEYLGRVELLFFLVEIME